MLFVQLFVLPFLVGAAMRFLISPLKLSWILTAGSAFVLAVAYFTGFGAIPGWEAPFVVCSVLLGFMLGSLVMGAILHIRGFVCAKKARGE